MITAWLLFKYVFAVMAALTFFSVFLFIVGTWLMERFLW